MDYTRQPFPAQTCVMPSSSEASAGFEQGLEFLAAIAFDFLDALARSALTRRGCAR